MKPCPDIVTYRAYQGAAPADYIARFVEHVTDPETGKRSVEFLRLPNSPEFTGFSHAQAHAVAQRWWNDEQVRAEQVLLRTAPSYVTAAKPRKASRVSA